MYVTRRDVLLDENSLYGARTAGYAMSANYSVNIDEPEDWLRAEALLAAIETVR